MSIFFISVAALIFWLIGGGILLAVASSWTPQPGKKLFVAYVSLMFLVLPIMELIFFATWMFWQNQYAQQGTYYGRGNGLDAWLGGMFSINALFVVMILLGSQSLLIIYSWVRRSSEGSLTGETRSQIQADGRVWNVTRQGAELVAILRRREWAFLVDIAPCVLFLVFFSFVFSVFFIDKRSFNNSSEELFTMMFLGFETLGIVYIILRDVFDGQSLGKRISGCRAVDFETGHAMRAEQAITRNLVFLIPFFPLVELAAASFRADRRRFGDLIAGTIVVPAQPDVIDGVVQINQMKLKSENNSLPVKHPLDD